MKQSSATRRMHFPIYPRGFIVVDKHLPDPDVSTIEADEVRWVAGDRGRLVVVEVNRKP